MGRWWAVGKVGHLPCPCPVLGGVLGGWQERQRLCGEVTLLAGCLREGGGGWGVHRGRMAAIGGHHRGISRSGPGGDVCEKRVAEGVCGWPVGGVGVDFEEAELEGVVEVTESRMKTAAWLGGRVSLMVMRWVGG